MGSEPEGADTGPRILHTVFRELFMNSDEITILSNRCRGDDFDDRSMTKFDWFVSVGWRIGLSTAVPFVSTLRPFSD